MAHNQLKWNKAHSRQAAKEWIILVSQIKNVERKEEISTTAKEMCSKSDLSAEI